MRDRQYCHSPHAAKRRLFAVDSGRELGTDEISRIREATTIELEAFVHGALCVSLSGNCYLSHYCGGRSANRGECAQPCRLRYSLHDGPRETDRGHLLSLKDMNRSAMLDGMLSAGITTFKIEGRLKDLDYVKNITAFYRTLLDKKISAAQDRFRPAAHGCTVRGFEPAADKSFNRGFTAYTPPFTGIASFESPASKGEELGRVRESGKGWLRLNTAPPDLAAGDGVFAPGNRPPAGDYIRSVDGTLVRLSRRSP